MEVNLTIFVARAAAIIYLTVGLGMLFNGKYYKKFAESFFEEQAAVYISGFMATIAGLAIVTYHNIWEGWAILVTIIGWLALAKGVIILLVPNFFKAMGKGMMRNPVAIGPIVIILGLVMGYFGFLA